MLTSDATRPLRTPNYGLLSIGELKTYSLLYKFLSSKVDSLIWASLGSCVCWILQCDCYCKKIRRDSVLVRPLHYTKPVSGYNNSQSQVIYDTSHISFIRTQFSATLTVKILHTNRWHSASFFLFSKYGLQRNSRTQLLSGKTRPQRTSLLHVCVV